MKIGQMEKVPFGSENLGKLQGILCEGLAISKKEQQISQSYQALRGSENVKNFCTQTFQLLPRVRTGLEFFSENAFQNAFTFLV